MGRPYDTAAWRRLPRETCAVAELFGTECAGPIALHHVRPLRFGGIEERTVSCCARHHPALEALARRVHGQRELRRCRHRHVTREARIECERRLNELVVIL